MDLIDHLNSAVASLFRFEGLQEYVVEQEREALLAFTADGTVSDAHMQDWWGFIDRKTKSGIVMERVRLVIEPLTDYTKMELELHKRSAEKGDVIKTITEDRFSELGIAPQDFWLIDDAKVLIMNYDEQGKYLGYAVYEDVTQFLKAKQLLLQNSKSI